MRKKGSITLNLAIYDGDPLMIDFETKSELIDYIKELKQFNAVWVVAEDGLLGGGGLVVTEDIDNIIKLIMINYFDYASEDLSVLYMHQYTTYEDAYSVALDMKEDNPKCYND